jgi:voltage-gated potassium channel
VRFRRVLERSWDEREDYAELLAARLDGPLTVAGIAFAAIVLADQFVTGRSPVRGWLDVAGWLLWAVFVFEFLLRMTIAPSTSAFFRRSWWQLIFLAVPFLRFLRPLARLRVPRVGRVVSSAVRTSRTAARRLSSRLVWLSVLTVIVVLAGSQIVFEFGEYASYGEALHAAALATVTGQPLGQESAALMTLDVVLGVYSVVVFAALAAMLAAFFMDRAGVDADEVDGQETAARESK